MQRVARGAAYLLQSQRHIAADAVQQAQRAQCEWLLNSSSRCSDISTSHCLRALKVGCANYAFFLAVGSLGLAAMGSQAAAAVQQAHWEGWQQVCSRAQGDIVAGMSLSGCAVCDSLV